MTNGDYRTGWFVKSDQVREKFHDLMERIDEHGGTEPWLLQLLEEIKEGILADEVMIEVS